MKINTEGLSSVTELKNYIKPSRIFKVGVLSTLSFLCISACNMGSGSVANNSTPSPEKIANIKFEKSTKSSTGSEPITPAEYPIGLGNGMVFTAHSGVPLPKDPLGTPIPGNPRITSLSVIDNSLWATTSDNNLWSVDLDPHSDYANSWKEADPGPLATIRSPVVGKYVAENGRSDLYFMVGWTIPVMGDHVCSIQYINRGTSGIPLNGPTWVMENATSYCQERSYPLTISNMGNNQHNAFTAIADRGILGIDLHTPWDSWSYGYEHLPTFPSAMYALQDKLFTVSGQNIYLSWTTLGYKDLWPIDMAPSPICGSDNPSMMQSNVIGNAGSGTVYICTTGGALIEGQDGKVAYYPTTEPIRMLAAISSDDPTSAIGNLYAVNSSSQIMEFSQKTQQWALLDKQLLPNSSFGDITAITAVKDTIIVSTSRGYAFELSPKVKNSSWYSPTATYALEPGQEITQIVNNNVAPADTTTHLLTFALLGNNHVYYKDNNASINKWYQIYEHVAPNGNIRQIQADRYNLYALTDNNQILWADASNSDAWYDCSPTGNAAIGFNPSQIMPMVHPRFSQDQPPSEKPYLFAIMESTNDNYHNTDIYSTDSCTQPNWVNRGTLDNNKVNVLDKSCTGDYYLLASTDNPFVNSIKAAAPSPDGSVSNLLSWYDIYDIPKDYFLTSNLAGFTFSDLLDIPDNGDHNHLSQVKWYKAPPSAMMVEDPNSLNESGMYVYIHLMGYTNPNATDVQQFVIPPRVPNFRKNPFTLLKIEVEPVSGSTGEYNIFVTIKDNTGRRQIYVFNPTTSTDWRRLTPEEVGVRRGTTTTVTAMEGISRGGACASKW